MDDRFDKEQNQTNDPEREAASHTRYPVREERQRVTLHSASQKKQETQSPKAEEPPMAEPPAEQTFQTRIPQAHTAQSEERRRERTSRQASAERPRRRSSRTAERETPSRRQKKKRRLSPLAKGLIVLAAALALFAVMFHVTNTLMNPPEEAYELTGETVSVTIPEGAGTEEIAQILKDNDLIGSVFGFKLTSRIEGYDGTYKQGTYNIDTGLTKRQIMALLQSGEVAQDLRLTIPEGYTVAQIAERVAETGLCTAEKFIQESNTGTFVYDFLTDLPDRTYRLEGYLFPDTYFLTEGMSAHDIIDMMLTRFDQMYTEEYRAAVAASGYSLDEIVTIASMVEKEIKVADERARAAGVIYNRLRENMSLGIDATVLYAVGKTAGELTQEDLDTDSPYNTRNRTGLPLGPIANPGESAFLAALYPETNNYLYYVLEGAGMDNHVFCETYDEFLTARQAYQNSLQ